jgi:hypothetical protein
MESTKCFEEYAFFHFCSSDQEPLFIALKQSHKY